MKVTKTIEWDMGHRVTNHHSMCRNLHGHRYKAEICVEGDIVQLEGISDEGMVIDFGDIKKVANTYIHDVLDHGCMIWEKDLTMCRFFQEHSDMKHIIVPFVPTSENIAAWVFIQLDSKFEDIYGTGLRLESVRIWETPTSTAICTRGDIPAPRREQ